MSNWVDMHLDVLATSPAVINQIERALQEPCDELIAWRAQHTGEDTKEIAGYIKEIVSLKAVRNLGLRVTASGAHINAKRELWLCRIAEALLPVFEKQGFVKHPMVRIGVGFPTTGARGKAVGHARRPIVNRTGKKWRSRDAEQD